MSHSASRLRVGLVGLSLVLGGCLLPQPHTPPVGLGLPGLVSKAPAAAKPADRIQVPDQALSSNGSAVIGQPAAAAKSEALAPNALSPVANSQGGIPAPSGGGLISNNGGGLIPSKGGEVIQPSASPVVGGCVLPAGAGQLDIESPMGVAFSIRAGDDTLTECGTVVPSGATGTRRSWQVKAGQVPVWLDLSQPTETSVKAQVDIREGQTTRLQLLQDPLTQEWRLNVLENQSLPPSVETSPAPLKNEADEATPQPTRSPSAVP